MFKVGDKVMQISGGYNTMDQDNGKIGIVIETGVNYYGFTIKIDEQGYWHHSNVGFRNEEGFKLVDENSNKQQENKMNIKESFTLAFKSEPEKSFRKAGIINGDDFLTQDGQNIFLSWLLKKQGADFKKEVVDELLKEIEEKA